MAAKNRCVVNQAKDFQPALGRARGKAKYTLLPYGKWGTEGEAGVAVTVKAEGDGLNAYHDNELIGPLSEPSVKAWRDKIIEHGGAVDSTAFLYYGSGWYAVVQLWDQDFLA